jgi:hypothetical protein
LPSAKRQAEMDRRFAADAAAFNPYLEPGERLQYLAIGVKQPNVILILLMTALFILPGLILVALNSKHYVVGLTHRRFIVLPYWGSGEINVKEVVAYRLDGLPQVVASTGPIFTHIKILDPAKRFVAKFHRHPFAGKNRAYAMAIAAVLTGKPAASPPLGDPIFERAGADI